MKYTAYHEAIKNSMSALAHNNDVVFIGQQVASENFYDTLEGIALGKRIEMPVAEELQAGLCTGLALEGYLPICIYQRMDFLLRAMDQLVNHLDKLAFMSNNLFNPKVIIRTTLGSKYPLDAGPQHTENYIEVFRRAFKSIPVVEITTAEEVTKAYTDALVRPQSTLIVEHQSLYYEF